MSASALYFGQVMHRRHHPQPHAFRYPIAQLLLDLTMQRLVRRTIEDELHGGLHVGHRTG